MIYNFIIIIQGLDLARMNPFLASIIFISISYILGLAKQFLFPSPANNKSNGLQQKNFYQVFELAPEELSQHQNKRILYNSLYEAYYSKTPIPNISQTPQRNISFSYNVLQQSLENQKKEFICGDQFLLLIWRGMRSSKNGNAQWINFIEIYRLPYLEKLDTLTFFGRTRIPKLCKKHKIPGRYQLGIVNENRPALITFNSTGKLSYQLNLLQYLDEYSLQIQIFDYTTKFWAYTSRQHPWVIKIAQKKFQNDWNEISGWVQKKDKRNYQRSSGVQTNTFLEIDLLDIEFYKSKQIVKTQIISIQHLFIKSLNNSLYLVCVYLYHNTEEKLKKIMQVSFKIQSETLSLLSHLDLYSEKPDGQEIMSHCLIFNSGKIDIQKQSLNLSCVIYKQNQQEVHFVAVEDVLFLRKKSNKNKAKKFNRNGSKASPSSEIESDFWKDLQEPYNQAQEDLMFLMRKMTPIAQPQAPFVGFQKSPLYVYKFHISKQYSEIKLIKPSLPDPIIFINGKKHYYLLTFTLPIGDNNINNKVSKDLIHQLRQKQEYKEEQPYKYSNTIRSVEYVEEVSEPSNGTQKGSHKMIIVMWGNRIEVLRYRVITDFPSQFDTDGIPMAVIIPFIELFATVFCMFQTVWGT